jgi:excisionase family DNA binding protein
VGTRRNAEPPPPRSVRNPSRFVGPVPQAGRFLVSARLLHSPEEAASILGVSRTCVYDLIRTGQLRSVKLGKARRIPSEALREFVEGLSVGSPR